MSIEFLKYVWSLRDDGVKVYPYKGERGPKTGLYSINFTNDRKNFEGMTEVQLVRAILDGRFLERGTIRMEPIESDSKRKFSAYAPEFYKGRLIRGMSTDLQRSTLAAGNELDLGDDVYEGAKKGVYVNRYERSKKARSKCLEYYGFSCTVCEFDFEEKYGELGKDFIHVHHIVPLSEIDSEYKVDPVKDLRPVCPNCHSMIHRGNEALSIQNLKKVIGK